jgi:hypothetical protein
VLVKGIQGELPHTTATHHTKTRTKLVFDQFIKVCSVTSFIQKHVSARGCKHCQF